MKTNTIYLIHFNRPYKHARHYLGSTNNLAHRLQRHRSGNGSRLMQVIVSAKITWRLARTWEGDRNRERQLKNQGSSKRHCPICRQRSGRDGRSRLVMGR